MPKLKVRAHGTLWGYRSGCRCAFCRAAEWVYRAAYREDHGVESKPRYWVRECAVCALHRRTGVSLGLHVYKNVSATAHSA